MTHNITIRSFLVLQWSLLFIMLTLPINVGAQETVITVNDDCSLIDAIRSANTDRPIGGCITGVGDDTIELTTDVLLTTIENEEQGKNGLPSVSSTITINGNGFTIERVSDSPAGDPLLKCG
jgi:hypothetical protein